jgi:hypothetical protein
MKTFNKIHDLPRSSLSNSLTALKALDLDSDALLAELIEVEDADQYVAGARDCIDGLSPTNSNPDYQAGYANQYAAEQIAAAKDFNKEL